MIFTPVGLEDAYVADISLKGDKRGWFFRAFCKEAFQQIGHTKEWVQMNHSYTAEKGTIRGMHFQTEPYREIKLVRCVAGAAFDVMVDLRKESATYLKWFGAEISAENKRMMYIPEGFAHGFQALTYDVELVYCHSAFYMPEYEAGILYNDPKVNIQWPLEPTVISERDKNHSPL